MSDLQTVSDAHTFWSTTMTKFTRLALSHTLSLPRRDVARTPWRAMTLATRLVAIPVYGSAHEANVNATFHQLFDPAAQFVPVFNAHPRRSHIVRPA
jgi:hypothetical protein